MSVAYVLIHCHDKHESSVIEQLKKIESVQEIQGVFGIYDIIIKVSDDDTKIIADTVSTQIRKLDNLKSTLTLMVSNPDGNYL